MTKLEVKCECLTEKEELATVEKEKICVCGDPESMHVDGCEQCFDEGCGCQEFEEDVCEMCHGTGEVEEFERDETGNFVWTGNKKCVCQTNLQEHE